MHYHNTLEKQVQQTLSATHLNDPAIQNLLKLVSASYNSFERDKNVLSHEIRTPLNSIIGLSHLLLQDELLPAQSENLRALNISAENLLNLVNDVLDFGNIEEGRIVLEEKNIDLRQLAGNIRMANRLRAEQRGNTIKLLVDPDLTSCVRGDDTRLMQVLNNLVSNAVKYTSNGCIIINLQLKQWCDQKVTVHFSVTDTGIGIEKERQPLLFDKFIQSGNEVGRRYGGSGVGLAIVKHLLQLYNSEICLNSEPGRGSEFSFDITFKKGRHSNSDTAIKLNSRRDLAGIKVLLVEDVDFNILVAGKMITNWNATVDVAENGIIAVCKARQESYDIILMDLQMPVMDGYSAAHHIREFNKNIPIVALTASALPDTAHKVTEFGMNDYLAKPFKPNELFEIIYQHTQKHITVPVLSHPTQG